MDLYKVLGPGGVDFPAFFAVLREGNYDGWIMLDYTAEVYAAFNSPAGAASDTGIGSAKSLLPREQVTGVHRGLHNHTL